MIHPGRRPVAVASLLLALSGALACATDRAAGPGDPDADLRRRALAAGVVPLDPAPPASPALVRLGQALFFDKILSGNRDIGCSTCHNPVYYTSDMLMVSIGTGGHRPGGSRQLGTGAFTTRHTTDLFNRGQPGWRTLLWDGRVEVRLSGLDTPLGAALPAGLDGPLAAQALLPLAARVEMRGHGADELAVIPDSEPGLVYQAIVARLRALPGYDSLFLSAFPSLPLDSVSIAHVVNALAAFIGTRWRADDSPFDRYLGGDDGALTHEQRRGGLLFFGRARCSACHNSPLFTDQRFHNTGLPVLGPGLPGGPDIGRGGVTGLAEDRYLFRTPPLRNVALTAPYMHNGSLRTLEDAVRHYRNPAQTLATFDAATIDPRLAATLDLSPARRADILATLDRELATPIALDDRDVADLVAFLKALTDPASGILLGDIPASVPSGLSVFDH